jgi:hypothetical protein
MIALTVSLAEWLLTHQVTVERSSLANKKTLLAVSGRFIQSCIVCGASVEGFEGRRLMLRSSSATFVVEMPFEARALAATRSFDFVRLCLTSLRLTVF